MPREDAHAKSERYLVQGRVRIMRCDEDAGFLAAEVRSDAAKIYVVAFDEGAWSCSCSAFSQRCAHLLAVQRVVVFEPRRYL
jgi:hypothetical protein